MTTSDTPETDANEAWPASNLKLGNDGVVSAEFARKLERERDEWARLCGQFKQERDEVKEKYRFAVIHWQIGAAKMERERDEAREALVNEISFHHRTHSELVEAQCKLLDAKYYDQLKS